MARPRKFVNTSDYPDFVIELLARTFYRDMLTDILNESSELLCCGAGARKCILDAYDVPEENERVMLKGVVSRKKQLIPALVATLQQ